MPIELRVPSVGESSTEVQVSKWLKKEGEAVRQDEPLVELETEKTTLEVPAPSGGVLQTIAVAEGEFTRVDAVLAVIDEKAETARPAAKPAEKPEEQVEQRGKLQERFAADKEEQGKVAPSPEPRMREPQPRIMPSARREMAERGFGPTEIEGTGPGGRVTKEDVLRASGQAAAEAKPVEEKPVREKPAEQPVKAARVEEPSAAVEELPVMLPPEEERRLEPAAGRGEEVVPMSPMRLRIAQRLVEAQQTAALLTTFNEIDMSELMRLRREYQESFQKEYEIKLGIMSFFVKAVVEGLKRIPQLNAEIRGRNIVYRNYYDIGIAIGSGKGLVVPILRNAESMSLAQVERAIDFLAKRVQEKKITPEELEGGTFTITNGGIYGSLLSTPIINPPQSGILGMHAIQDRPIAHEGQVVIRPMMYVALTYDHRIVDGREAVTFLKHVKEMIEEPARILLEI